MYRISSKMAGLALLLTVVLAGGVTAQQQQQRHHPDASQTPKEPSVKSGSEAPERPQMMQGMMGNMQGMMEHMQGMMENMQGMMGRGGMTGRRGMMTQEEDDDESFQSTMMGRRGMMGMGGMMQRHLERVAEQLELTDEQRTQVRTLLGTQAKEAIRARADLEVLAIDLRQLLDTAPIDLPRVKQQLQTIATKEADIRFAQISALQDISKLLTPEQRQKFRAMRGSMMGWGGMMGQSGMMGRGRSQQ